MIMRYFRRRRLAKSAKEWLHHARHCRKIREDVASQTDLDALAEAEQQLRMALRDGHEDRMEQGCERVQRAAAKVMPPRSLPGFRENLEVVVVALAIAMAFRCYFLQPFKIPTGSMQPTLYGIHYEPKSGPDWSDQMPFRMVKWLGFGGWYEEMKAEVTGRVRGPVERGGMMLYEIGGYVHPVPRGMLVAIKASDEVVKGQIIARGTRITGDHLFVNRVKWNFSRPRRGEVMVFRTDGIPALDEKKTHYIKRLMGLPGESIRIVPPNVLVGGHPALEDPMIRMIAGKAPGYDGYTLAEGIGARRLVTTNDVITLRADQYLGFGDNTRNSFDSRYWGPVPAASMVGPAMIVYWPISSRWGIIR